MTQPLISIVVACHGNAQELTCLLSSLHNQKRYVTGPHSVTGVPVPHSKCVAWGKEFPGVEVILSFDGRCHTGDFCTGILYDGGFQYKEIENEKLGGVGHHTRGPGIEAATGKWVTCQNMDHQFTLGWLDQIYPHLIDESVGMVYTNCINNLWAWTDFGGSKLKRGGIDLSCAIVRSEIAKEVGWPWSNYDSDFDWINACAVIVNRLKLKLIHVPKALVIHN